MYLLLLALRCSWLGCSCWPARAPSPTVTGGATPPHLPSPSGYALPLPCGGEELLADLSLGGPHPAGAAWLRAACPPLFWGGIRAYIRPMLLKNQTTSYFWDRSSFQRNTVRALLLFSSFYLYLHWIFIYSHFFFFSS